MVLSRSFTPAIPPAAIMTMRLLQSGGLLLILIIASLEAAAPTLVDVIDYREPIISNLFAANDNTITYTLLQDPYLDLSVANGASSAKGGERDATGHGS